MYLLRHSHLFTTYLSPKFSQCTHYRPKLPKIQDRALLINSTYQQALWVSSRMWEISNPPTKTFLSLSLSLSLSLPPTTRNPNFHSEVRSQNPKKEILIVILRKQKTPEKLQKTKRDAFSSRKNRVIFSFLFFSSVQIATALKV
jgi:hypothetical protein